MRSRMDERGVGARLRRSGRGGYRGFPRGSHELTLSVKTTIDANGVDYFQIVTAGDSRLHLVSTPLQPANQLPARLRICLDFSGRITGNLRRQDGVLEPCASGIVDQVER